jgi:hypothetical protein
MSIQTTNDTHMTSEKWVHYFSDVFFLLVTLSAEWEDPSLMLFVVGSMHSQSVPSRPRPPLRYRR